MYFGVDVSSRQVKANREQLARGRCAPLDHEPRMAVALTETEKEIVDVQQMWAQTWASILP